MSLPNETGEDIWFLHMPSEAMYRVDDEGPDLLGDDLWYAGSVFAFAPDSFKHIPDALWVNPGQNLHVLACTLDDVLYHRLWNPENDRWSLSLQAVDLLK